MAFENFPYTDFHNLNLDWLLSRMKELLSEYSGIMENIEKISADLKELAETVDHFYDPEVFFNTVYNVVKEYVDSGVFEAFIKNAVEEYYVSGTPSHTLSNAEKQAMYITAMSYYSNAWATRNSNIAYGNAVGRTDGKGTVLDDPYNTVSDYSLIDCSTFVLLCLMAFQYKYTKYASSSLGESPTSKIGYDRDFIITAYPESKGSVRWSYEIYLQAMLNRWLYKPKSISDIQTGDIVFFKWTQDWIDKNPDSFGAKAYNNIAHVAMAVDNCSAFTGGIGIVHATSSSAVMKFDSLNDYISKLTTQEFVPYVMRPVLNCQSFYTSGVYRFRRGLPVVQSNSSYTFVSGGVPTNMGQNKVDKSTGAITSDKTRYTSYFIPASLDFFVSGALTGVGYNVCFYKINTSETQDYTGYSQNKTDVDFLKKADLLRIEFYKSDGSEITSIDMSNINTSFQFMYHSFPDDILRYPAGVYANNYERDSIRFSPTTIRNTSQIII